MPTASTKSANNKKRGAPASPSRVAPEPPVTLPDFSLSQRGWLIACALIILVAAFLRFYHLDLVPLHHDEGVNGNFLVRLLATMVSR